jgi:hypothetical protein
MHIHLMKLKYFLKYILHFSELDAGDQLEEDRDEEEEYQMPVLCRKLLNTKKIEDVQVYGLCQ